MTMNVIVRSCTWGRAGFSKAVLTKHGAKSRK